MSLRESLNRSPKASAALGIGLFTVSVALVAWLLMSNGSSDSPSDVQLRQWFTADDGATWFAEDIRKPSPFKMADGREAVKAAVYKCGHGKTFVQYLERKNPAMPAEPDEAKAAKTKDPYARYRSISQMAVQVKRPGSGTWVSMGAPAAGKIMSPVCPEGSEENIEPVDP